ncbi:MAG: desulfoferrodoxin family protein [Coriobacteriia bacterium]|nr:desulfoferrodoxin family protein [Coriobacteriia bacterium]
MPHGNQEIQEVLDLETASDFEIKHFPTLEALGDNKFKVTVGKDITHPQTEEHLIDEINLFVNGRLAAEKKLEPGQEQVAEFEVQVLAGDQLYALADCNLHGVFKSHVLKA